MCPVIQVALDWICILELEEARAEAPFLRQIQHWAEQGDITLCLCAPAKLENPRDRSQVV